MRASYLVTVQIEEEIGWYTPVVDVCHEYDGAVMLCKKGRETVEQNMKTGQQRSAVEDAAAVEAQKRAAGLYGEMEGSTVPGTLTPAATAQLASDRDNIGRVYNGMRQTAFRTMGQRGFGSAPSGFNLAAQNGIDQGQANNETEAYRAAQERTQAQRNFAATGESNMSGQQGNLSLGNLGSSTGAAIARNSMGSTLGDIGQGISAGAGIVGSFMGMPGLSGAFSKMGKAGTPGSINTLSPSANLGSY